MALYQVSYDLRKVRDQFALHERIRSYGTYARVLEASWIIRTDQSADQIRDYLAEVMDQDDGLLVVKLTGEAGWKGLKDDRYGGTSKWIKWVISQEHAA